MMKHNYIFEDKRLPKLPVRFAEDIIKKIDLIRDANSSNDNLSQLYEYINGLKSYISNPVIAWDNTNKYKHNSKGETFINEIGYEVGFIIKTQKNTNTNYIYVFNIKFPLNKFDLEIPSDLDESQRLKQLSREDYCRFLLEKYDAYLHSLFM